MKSRDWSRVKVRLALGLSRADSSRDAAAAGRAILETARVAPAADVAAQTYPLGDSVGEALGVRQGWGLQGWIYQQHELSGASSLECFGGNRGREEKFDAKERL